MANGPRRFIQISKDKVIHHLHICCTNLRAAKLYSIAVLRNAFYLPPMYKIYIFHFSSEARKPKYVGLALTVV